MNVSKDISVDINKKVELKNNMDLYAGGVQKTIGCCI